MQPKLSDPVNLFYIISWVTAEPAGPQRHHVNRLALVTSQSGDRRCQLQQCYFYLKRKKKLYILTQAVKENKALWSGLVRWTAASLNDMIMSSRVQPWKTTVTEGVTALDGDPCDWWGLTLLPYSHILSPVISEPVHLWNVFLWMPLILLVLNVLQTNC